MVSMSSTSSSNPMRLHPSKRSEGLPGLTQAEEHLAHADHGVLVAGLQAQRVVEGLPGPGELLPGEAGVPEPDVQLHRIRVEGEPFLQRLEGRVVVPVVVEIVCALVVLF
jgi:hypothetical protein